MLIRNLRWKGFAMWPPEWTVFDLELGETGVLEDVRLREDLEPKLISVVANHLGEIRKGIMLLEDPDLLRVVYATLKQHVGLPLTEIGDLEIIPLPPPPKPDSRQVHSPGPPQLGGQIRR